MQAEIATRLDKIEALLCLLVERQTAKDFYEIDEFARRVGRAAYTVRRWAKIGRIKATKRRSGRGAFCSWAVSHAELLRYQKEGLLPRVQ